MQAAEIMIIMKDVQQTDGLLRGKITGKRGINIYIGVYLGRNKYKFMIMPNLLKGKGFCQLIKQNKLGSPYLKMMQISKYLETLPILMRAFLEFEIDPLTTDQPKQ